MLDWVLNTPLKVTFHKCSSYCENISQNLLKRAPSQMIFYEFYDFFPSSYYVECVQTTTTKQTSKHIFKVNNEDTRK